MGGLKMKNYKNLSLPVLNQTDIDLLEELSNACAVSGNEREVRKIVRREIQPIADSFEVDALGNAVAVKKAKTENFTRILVSAHMDEIGFMLVNEEDPGIFRFKSVGGIDPRQMAGKSVLVGPDHISGIIGACPVHLTTPEDRKRPSKNLTCALISVRKTKLSNRECLHIMQQNSLRWAAVYVGKHLMTDSESAY